MVAGSTGSTKVLAKIHNLAGEVLWGPKTIEADLLVSHLQACVCEALHVPATRVQLLHCERLLDPHDLAVECVPDGAELLALAVKNTFSTEAEDALKAPPFNLTEQEVEELEKHCSERGVVNMRLVARMDGRGNHQAYVSPFADQPGPWLIIGATKPDISAPACVVGGFHSSRFWERSTKEYGYDFDPTAFIFAFATPQGRQSIVLPIRPECASKAVHHGPSCLLDFGSGSLQEADLEFRLGEQGDADVGACVSSYGPSGTSWDCLLGPEAKGWNQIRKLDDFLILHAGPERTPQPYEPGGLAGTSSMRLPCLKRRGRSFLLERLSKKVASQFAVIF